MLATDARVLGLPLAENAARARCATCSVCRRRPRVRTRSPPQRRLWRERVPGGCRTCAPPSAKNAACGNTCACAARVRRPPLQRTQPRALRTHLLTLQRGADAARNCGSPGRAPPARTHVSNACTRRSPPNSCAGLEPSHALSLSLSEGGAAGSVPSVRRGGPRAPAPRAHRQPDSGAHRLSLAALA